MALESASPFPITPWRRTSAGSERRAVCALESPRTLDRSCSSTRVTFTFICPTELAAFAERHDDFLRERAVVLAASTDSYFSHKAWFESDPRLAEVRYPVIADTAHKLSRSPDVLLEDGATHRGTFIVDPTGLLLHMSVNEHDVGRSVDEVADLASISHRALLPGRLGPR